MVRQFAIIENGIVANAILADAWPDGIDITDLDPRPAPGWLFDGQAFSRPADAGPPARDFIPYAEFVDSWTPDELTAFYAQRRTQPALEAFETLLQAIGGVRLGSAKAEAGKAALVALGILTQERADVLFSP